MANATLERLNEERTSQVDFVSQLLEGVEAEGRDLSPTEREAITRAETRTAEIDAQIEPLIAFETRRAAAADITKLGRGPIGSGAATPTFDTRSLGERWTESDQYRDYNGRGTSGTLFIPEFRAIQTRAAGDPILTTTSPGSVLLPKPVQYRAPEHYRTYKLLSLVSTVEVSSNSVEIVTIGDATGATVVAENAQKPPIVWTASSTTVTLATVAGWMKYSRQALRDIPQISDLINQKIRRAIDTQLNTLATTAVNSAFTGGNTTTGGAGVKLVDLIRGAIATLQGRGVNPTAVIVNPADAAAIDIAMLASPGGGGGMVIYGAYWGLDVITAPEVTAGTAIVGDVQDGITYFHKAGLSLFTTDSDITGSGATAESDFRANRLTTLGETFGVFAVTDASVLQKVVATP